MQFNAFNLNDELNVAIEKNNYTKPTKIQEQVIPLILQNYDVKAQSQTGSGKTAAFVLPILHKFRDNYVRGKPKIRVLVLTPTRELAQQVSQTFLDFSKNFEKRLELVTFIGGASIGDQLHSVQKGCEVLVCTPGRLLDILSKKQINLSFVEFFVLDEADKMLDLGFESQLDEILEELPEKRQNLMFSATYNEKMLNIVSKITREAKDVIIKEEALVVEKIQQRIIEVNKENKRFLLKHLIKTNEWPLVLVFMATKRACDNIAQKFRNDGFEAESFHGALEQDEREYTLKDFKDKKIQILFCTDIAARGLHIDDITCVVNYDLPRASSDYVHRIGRTGRANKDGIAVTFVSHEDKEHFSLIEKKCNLDIIIENVVGYELRGEVIEKQKGEAPIKGKRKSKKDKLREKALKDPKKD